MKYRVYLTQASEEAKERLSHRFSMCPCCYKEGVEWLSANTGSSGGIVIHGWGSPDGTGMSAREVCRFLVGEDLYYGHTVVLTPDVEEFERMADEYAGK